MRTGVLMKERRKRGRRREKRRNRTEKTKTKAYNMWQVFACAKLASALKVIARKRAPQPTVDLESGLSKKERAQ